MPTNPLMRGFAGLICVDVLGEHFLCGVHANDATCNRMKAAIGAVVPHLGAGALIGGPPSVLATWRDECWAHNSFMEVAILYVLITDYSIIMKDGKVLHCKFFPDTLFRARRHLNSGAF